MWRTAFVGIFLSLYALLAGPPLLLYTLISRNPNPLYWAGVMLQVYFLEDLVLKQHADSLTEHAMIVHEPSR